MEFDEEVLLGMKKSRRTYKVVVAPTETQEERVFYGRVVRYNLEHRVITLENEKGTALICFDEIRRVFSDKTRRY